MAGTYCSKADIDNLYGEALLKRLADRDRDGIPDQEIVDSGLQSADDLIDGYVGGIQPLPLPAVPGLLRRLAVDIAVYTIALGRAERTDEMRQRYDDALALLDKISKGTIALVIPTAPGSGTGTGGTGTGTDTTGGDKRLGRSVNSYRS